MKNIMNKKLLVAIVLAALILFTIAPVAGAHSEITGDADFMEIMEEIGHDLEHIHEDMHTVAFSMKIISYSTVAIAVLMLVAVIMINRKKA